MILEEKKIDSFDKTKLQLYISEKGKSTWIIVVHGIGEHAGRHLHLEEEFGEYFNILYFDLRGHGASEGRRAYIESFDTFCLDLEVILNFLKENYDLKKYVLFGHSMGGLITSRFMQEYVKKDFYPVKVILSSPAVSASGILGKIFHYGPYLLTKSLKDIPLSLPLKGILNLKKLSHDIHVYDSFMSDKNNILKLESKLLFELVNASKITFSKPLRINCELYVVIGTGDAFVEPNYVIKYFSNIEKNANLEIIEGGYHELHNEISKYHTPYLQFIKKALMENIFN